MNKNSNKATLFKSIFYAAVAFTGIAIVFLTSVSTLSFQVKAGVALSVVVAELLIVYFAAIGEGSDVTSHGHQRDDGKAGIIEEELSVLEEAAVFFSASIKQDEMLRLLEARLGAAVQNCTARIFRLTPDGILDAPHTGRSESMTEIPARVALLTDTAAKALTTNAVLRSNLSANKRDKRRSSGKVAAIALRRAEEVFCVLTFTCEADGELPSDETILAISQRITPLISGSVSFETSIANALRDSLTNLPNERAMYLLLENQVAESQRFGSTRPLTVLAIDIRSFDEINNRFGHSTGDRLLVFASDAIKAELRKMDMLARTADDEFVVILPTANVNSSNQVIERLDRSFSENRFELPDGSEHSVQLSYGIASFGEDGDTASEIVRRATERKRVKKSSENGSVIEFPKNKPA